MLDSADVAEERLARAGRPHETGVGVAAGPRRSATRRRRPGRTRPRRSALATWGSDSAVRERWNVPFVVASRPPDHVHVDARDDARDELGVADEIGLRARDLGQPEEADRPPRTRQRALPDRRRERARDLEDRGAAGGVVVGAGGLVAEVRGQDDLARRRDPCPGSSRRRRRRSPGPSSRDTRARSTIFSPAESRARKSSACRFETMNAKRFWSW